MAKVLASGSHAATLPRSRNACTFVSNRLFIGLEISAECKEALAALDPRLPGLRWLPAGQMHLTLSFLGDVPRNQQETLEANLGQVRVPAFFLPLQGLGSFNARGQPSVVWAGVGKGHPHLFALHKHVQDAVLRSGLEPDLKPFHPHVTVARGRGISKQALQPFLRKYHESDFGLFQATEFILFSSLLAPEGATHFAELRVPLTMAP